jgi:uncharacterized protein (TIGR02145 family)
MSKAVTKTIRLFFISLILLELLRCDEKTDPCSELSPMQQLILCIAKNPANNAIISPVKVELKWESKDGSTYKLFFGTDKNNLQLISTLNGETYLLPDLEVNTKYYWRVSAATICGNVCSTEIREFTTVPNIDLPYVITAPVYPHLNYPPRAGGNVVYEGSSVVIDHGIYFSLLPDPEITGSEFPINAGMGVFSVILPQLVSNTKYYVKAYAKNNSGISYGAETSFFMPHVNNYTSINDIDGNSYFVINIGNQTWMAENLRTSRFNDGTPIAEITNENLWGHTNSPAYCWYDNNMGIQTTYGALYNYYTIDTATNGHRNVCPVGWHVPDDTEWNQLIGFLGGKSIAGTKLKEVGDFYWSHPPGTNWPMGDNSSDFSALAGGERIDFDAGYGAVFLGIWLSARFWSRGLNGISHYLTLETSYSNAEIFPELIPRNKDKTNGNGYSVRCIKD